MSVLELREWVLTPGSTSVNGAIYGSLKYQDGERITTSFVTAVKDKVITTHTGSQYRLVGSGPLRMLKHILAQREEAQEEKIDV